MIKRMSLVISVAAVVTLIPAAAASAATPTGNGCVGKFVLVDVSAGAHPDAPQHKDVNADGYLCYNGRTWQGNQH